MRVLRLVEEGHHRDAEGRPLREGRTPSEHLRADDIEYRTCQYPGSRRAMPMNVSALRQTSAHWDAILGALAGLRARYAEARGSYAPDVMDLWRVSQLGCALPWFHILARDEVAPAHAAALSKITLGTALLAHRVLHDLLVAQQPPVALTADALLALAESTGTLVGDAEVCAAPAKMIVDFCEVMVTGMPAPPITDDVLRFCAHYVGFKQLVWMHFLARRVLRPGDDAPCVPPDCVVIEPAWVTPPLRPAWFAALAALVIPIAPDGSDVRLRTLAADLVPILGDRAALDANLAEVVRVVEVGFGGTPGGVEPERLLGPIARP